MNNPVKAGGVDMPPKKDMFDMTTPSGEMPIILSPAQYKQFQDAGADMRFYAANKFLPRWNGK